MLTRRQFLLGLGALAATTLLSFSWSEKLARTQDQETLYRETPPDCDWVLDNVFIVDGTGGPGYSGRVAVKGQFLVAVGDFTLPDQVKVIDGQGLVLAPGFIDIHAHTESFITSGENPAPLLSQGITMQVGGNCGRSPRDVAAYLETVANPPINFGILMGYGTLREMALGGNRAGKVGAGYVLKMQELLAGAFEAGALGFSTGLEYWPQNNATREELLELCAVVKEYGGFYATHIRSEYDEVIPALEEAVEIGLNAGVPVQYSHIKAGYQRNWPKFPLLLELLTQAGSSGLDLTADVYPYTFSSNDVGTNPLRHSISEENIALAVQHPRVFFGSDMGLYQRGRANHPRAYGTYPRILGRLVREENLLSLENAVAKMTAQPAGRLGLKDRGRLLPGCRADLVLFDPRQIIDRATPEDTATSSEGVRQVWLNGTLVWDDSEVLVTDAGQWIRKLGG